MKQHLPSSFLFFVLGAVVSTGVLTQAFGPTDKLATAANILDQTDTTASSDGNGTVAGGSQCDPVSYNRSVDTISFRHDGSGPMFVDVGYSFVVTDTQGAQSNLGADIRLVVVEGGQVVHDATLVAETQFASNDAITCAVACASPCGSIFGDGVCSGCGCNYNRFAAFPLPTQLPPGATLRASILPHPNAAPEIRTDDDVLVVTFGDPEPCCPADLNGNGAVDVDDLLILLGLWGPCQ